MEQAKDARGHLSSDVRFRWIGVARFVGRCDINHLISDHGAVMHFSR